MTTKVITQQERSHYYHYVFRNGDAHWAAISSNNVVGAQGEWLFSMMPDFVDIETAREEHDLKMAETFLTLDEFAIIAFRHMQLVEGTYEDSKD